MIRLIVLDCDGVMVDSKESNIRYYNDVLKSFGHPPMNVEDEEFCHMSTVRGAFEYLFKNYPQSLDEVQEQIKKGPDYSAYKQYIRLEPDLRDFLDATKDKYKLAISTNRSDTMIPLLEEYNIEHYFAKVMTALNARRPKPAPDGLLEILEELQCAPEQTLFIGDSILDRMQASACGVSLVAFKNDSLDAEYHVNSFMEILQLPPFTG